MCHRGITPLAVSVLTLTEQLELHQHDEAIDSATAKRISDANLAFGDEEHVLGDSHRASYTLTYEALFKVSTAKSIVSGISFHPKGTGTPIIHLYLPLSRSRQPG